MKLFRILVLAPAYLLCYFSLLTLLILNELCWSFRAFKKPQLDRITNVLEAISREYQE